MSEDVKNNLSGLEQYATSGVLKFAGSILVLSLALNTVGFRADKLLDAWSESIIAKTTMSAVVCPTIPEIQTPVDLKPIDVRLRMLESIAHESSLINK
jgi:hypothetical protein